MLLPEYVSKLNRNQLRWVTERFTGHCHLSAHAFKFGLTNNLAYEKGETTTHILC
jgi:hypothetical protein